MHINYFLFWPYWLIPCDPNQNCVEGNIPIHILIFIEQLSLILFISVCLWHLINRAYPNSTFSLRLWKSLQAAFMVYALFFFAKFNYFDFDKIDDIYTLVQMDENRPVIEKIEHQTVVKGASVNVTGNNDGPALSFSGSDSVAVSDSVFRMSSPAVVATGKDKLEKGK